MDGREILVSTIRSVFGMVPLVGQALNEALFEYRSRMQQKRLEAFVQAITQQVEHLQASALTLAYCQSEEFVDFFEAVVLRVLRARSEEKRRRLSEVFVRQLYHPQPFDFEEAFLDLILAIHEPQITILMAYREFANIFLQKDFLASIGGTSPQSEHETAAVELAAFRTASYYHLDEETYQTYLLDLIARALLFHTGVPKLGTTFLAQLEITLLGRKFLHFIQAGEESLLTNH